MMRRERPFVFTNVKTGSGVEEVLEFLLARGGLRKTEAAG